MKTVTVNASKSYDVIIGTELLTRSGKYICAVKKPCTAAIISNVTVWPLYGDLLATSLQKSGFRVIHYNIGDGESFKNQQTYLQILTFLAENNVTRSDLIIALGGGVVGDITGFSAATYLRGVDYIQIPTTLLAMVDSSVGGKTAIDLPQGKNLVGAFYQPKLVLCDLSTLDTLSTEVFTDGCAEVIKYGVLYDPLLFEHLSQHGPTFDKEYVIWRCVCLKRDVVAEDEFDTGARQKLNLGHTIGHAIEKNSNFTLSHGRAVALGMAIITKAAYQAGICSEDVYDRIISVLMKFTLPASIQDITSESSQYEAGLLWNAALSDKKRSAGTVNLIIPQSIGECIIQNTDIKQLKCIIESGL